MRLAVCYTLVCAHANHQGVYAFQQAGGLTKRVVGYAAEKMLLQAFVTAAVPAFYSWHMVGC